MASNPNASFSETVPLPDGREIIVRAYDNGEVRLKVSGAPYVLKQCFLSINGQAEILLSPGGQGSAVPKKY
jgi:hypothetical protein